MPKKKERLTIWPGVCSSKILKVLRDYVAKSKVENLPLYCEV